MICSQPLERNTLVIVEKNTLTSRLSGTTNATTAERSQSSCAPFVSEEYLEKEISRDMFCYGIQRWLT